MTMENNKTNESHKLFLNLPLRLHISKTNNHVDLQILSINYTWENVRKQNKNIELKIIASTWNDEFELPYGSYSVSDIQDYIELFIKKHEQKFTKVYPILVYINKINNRLVFKLRWT